MILWLNYEIMTLTFFVFLKERLLPHLRAIRHVDGAIQNAWLYQAWQQNDEPFSC
jgi:hypothetical protein